ncbi:MAG TPA: NAD(P)-dependent oxidoreductase [Gaiellaceae bacterium]|nr:NAD(P)-dependent oxidoreductase [Gaiellaceae bacterium]
MRVLVTGATGFIGRNLLAVLTADHEVFALTRGEVPDDRQEAHWIEEDLCSLRAASLPAQIDAVVHLAQSRRYREFPDGAADMFAVNVESTFRLLEYARGAGAEIFVLASTGGVYGGSPAPITEDDEIDPVGFYPASKAAAETLASGYDSALATVVLRFFFVYGPGQEKMLVPSLIERVRSGDEIVIDGDPGLRMNPIHVCDAVQAFEPALRLGRSDVFNVAGEEAVSITDLLGVIGQELGTEADVRHTDAEPPGDLVAANRKLKDVLGVTPRISLAEGIRSMLQP